MINKVGKLAIIGAGGHSKVVKEIAYLNGYSNIFFLMTIKKKITKHAMEAQKN